MNEKRDDNRSSAGESASRNSQTYPDVDSERGAISVPRETYQRYSQCGLRRGPVEILIYTERITSYTCSHFAIIRGRIRSPNLFARMMLLSPYFRRIICMQIEKILAPFNFLSLSF